MIKTALVVAGFAISVFLTQKMKMSFLFTMRTKLAVFAPLVIGMAAASFVK